MKTRNLTIPSREQDPDVFRRFSDGIGEGADLWRSYDGTAMAVWGYQTSYTYMSRREWRLLPLREDGWDGETLVRNRNEKDPRTYQMIIHHKKRVLVICVVTFSDPDKKEK
jgi:hypothetical protein